jgi:hypothetical protein
MATSPSRIATSKNTISEGKWEAGPAKEWTYLSAEFKFTKYCNMPKFTHFGLRGRDTMLYSHHTDDHNIDNSQP